MNRNIIEELISQLPAIHEGRNTWLMNHGITEEADKIREERMKFLLRNKANWKPIESFKRFLADRSWLTKEAIKDAD